MNDDVFFDLLNSIRENKGITEEKEDETQKLKSGRALYSNDHSCAVRGKDFSNGGTFLPY